MTASNLPDEELARLLLEIAWADALGMIERARSRALARAERLIEDALVEELLAAARGAPRRRTDTADSPLAATSAQKPETPEAPEAPKAQEAPEVPPAREAPHAREAPQAPEEEPTGADGAEAWWTYCIMRGVDASQLPAELEGVEPGGHVEVIHDGDLAALVSRVPLPEYGDERLRVHLEDLDWVGRTARRHEDVLDVALRVATIVPLRLCTLFRSRNGVHRLLREHREALREGLSRVEGCVEWGVKVFADPHASTGEAVPDPEDADSRGVAYLQRRQQERALAEKAGEVRARCVEVIYERIQAVSRVAKSNPPQRPEVHGRELTMLLNGACLVERDRAAELRAAVDTLQEEWSALGFTIELTGPWPPYNFVSGAAGVLS